MKVEEYFLREGFEDTDRYRITDGMEISTDISSVGTEKCDKRLDRLKRAELHVCKEFRWLMASVRNYRKSIKNILKLLPEVGRNQP